MGYCKIHGDSLYDGEPCRHCIAERRALYREAYMAALNGTATLDIPATDLMVRAKTIALVTVTKWDAMIAELEGE